MQMEFNQDFRDMLLELNAVEVDYMIVGAYAVAAHGHPRATGDLDIWVRADCQTAPQVVLALERFGAPVEQIDVSDFSQPSVIFQIGVPPGRIDILTKISGVEFSDAWNNRKQLNIEDLTFHVIGFEDLILNKRASGRPKDLLDVDILLTEPKG